MFDEMTRAAIFDVDGTLVLSNAAHAAAWSRAFAQCGFFDVTPPRVRPLVGLSGPDLVARLKPKLDSQTQESVVAHHREIFNAEYLPRLSPAPGARTLTVALKAQGLSLIAASSARRNELKALLAAAGVGDVLTAYVCADDVDEGKPSSDIVQVALERLDVAPLHACMVGDTPYDIAAAHGAGVSIVAVRCGGATDSALGEADAIVDDPEHLRVLLSARRMPYTVHEARASR